MSATGKCRRLPTEGGGFARASYFEHDLFGKPLHTFPDHAVAQIFI
jgi:hypothetical protein